MKHLILFFCLAAVLRADDAALLRAIAEVETGNHPRTGRAGERGVHQMGPAARSDHATPLAHLHWLVTTLRAGGEIPTPFVLALAWNAGATAVLEGRTTARQRDYAARVRNLYEEFSKE
jgi:hypothetical protein